MSDNIRIRAHLRSGIGKLRKNNEDNYYLNGCYSELSDVNIEKNLSMEFTKNDTLFAVCDGMGGIANGEIASFMACKQLSFLQSYFEKASYAEALQKWITCSNRSILNSLENGGCTLALIFIDNGFVHISNVGDSRVYCFSDNKLTQLSKDHSKVQIMVDAGFLTEEQAEKHPQKNIITRYLGMDEHLVGSCAPYHAPLQRVRTQDYYLICSDGLSDMVTNKQIEEIMLHSKTAYNCAQNLYNAALEAGGKDNITLIVLEFA